MLELVDTHVHLDDPRLCKDLEQILTEAQQAGVKRLINIGHNLESSRASLQLAQRYNNIWAAVGVHPHSAKEMTAAHWEELQALAVQPKVVAIGEIGLDYHYDHSPRPVQREVFKGQLELAKEVGLPVVIHQREAVQETLGLLKQFAPLPHGGVMHCFSGSVETLRQCLEMNLHIGLGGTVTFANARRVKEVAAAVPLSRLVLETDCPYLAPHPHRGKTNRPGFLPLIAEEISKLRSLEVDQLAAICAANAEALFALGINRGGDVNNIW